MLFLEMVDIIFQRRGNFTPKMQINTKKIILGLTRKKKTVGINRVSIRTVKRGIDKENSIRKVLDLAKAV